MSVNTAAIETQPTLWAPGDLRDHNKSHSQWERHTTNAGIRLPGAFEEKPWTFMATPHPKPIPDGALCATGPADIEGLEATQVGGPSNCTCPDQLSAILGHHHEQSRASSMITVSKTAYNKQENTSI